MSPILSPPQDLLPSACLNGEDGTPEKGVIYIVLQNKVNEGPGGGGANEEVDEGAD